MKIIATADLHGELPNWRSIPEADVLVIAGDVCPGLLANEQWRWLQDSFVPWLEALPVQHVIGIGGNHDYIFESHPQEAEKLPWTYLCDSGTEINGVKFWGTPWVPNLSKWSFHLDDERLYQRLAMVPTDTDVVISHGPPYGHCDFYGGQPIGFPGTLAMLRRVRPHVYICGHIHEAYGMSTYHDTLILNVAHGYRHQTVRGKPVLLDLNTNGCIQIRNSEDSNLGREPLQGPALPG